VVHGFTPVPRGRLATRIGEKSAERKVCQRRFFMSRVNPRPTRLANMSRLPFAKALRIKSRDPHSYLRPYD
jgi:hypothetical protein